ncbi:MAG: tetratricopeptide repeat protein [Flammeovirgaceae bacterium]|nr:tetratricopeptide repeat protein [Flammeovirgaceae bacterium]
MSKFRVFLLIALFLFSWSKVWSQSDKVLDSLKISIVKSENDSMKSVALARLGFYLHDIDSDSSLFYSSKALKLAEKINFKLGIGESCYSLSHYYWITGLYREALNLALKSLSLFELDINNNAKRIADTNILIGNIYSYLNDYELAKRYYKKTENVLFKFTDLALKTRCYNNLGYIYMKQENYDSASHYLNESLVINRKNLNIRGEAYNLSNLGEIALKEKRFDEAISQLKESNSLAEEVGELRLKARNYGEVSKIYIALRKIKLAQSYAQMSFLTSRQINASFEKKEAAKLLYQIMESKGKSDSALMYHKIYMKIEDSLLRKRLTVETQLLVNNYELLKKEAEVKLLKSENELSKAQLSIDVQKIKNQKVIIFLSLLLLAILFLLIFVNYRRYKSNLEYSKTLAAVNEKISSQNEEIIFKSEELQTLNEKLSELNEKLEIKVEERTKQVLDRNLQLEEYAFINSHKLRGPVASILGLIHLFEKQLISQDEFSETLLKLKNSSIKLDRIIAEINEVLNRSDK